MKQLKCDLHIHSNHSDGSFSPAWIISKAKELNLCVALTDHNTTLGLETFMREAEKAEVIAVPGIELSTVCGEKELHLLGLFVETEYYSKIESLLKEFHVLKEESNINLIKNLNKAGYDIHYSDVKKKNENGRINRAHIATYLVEKGYVSTTKEAFKTLLNEKSGFYMPPKRLGLYDAISFLREIKAVPVLAHPLLDLEDNQLTDILPRAISAGLLGIETHHSTYSEEKIKTASDIAIKFGILQSGGSDFHGEAKPDIFMGKGKGNMSVPYEFYTSLLEKKKAL